MLNPGWIKLTGDRMEADTLRIQVSDISAVYPDTDPDTDGSLSCVMVRSGAVFFVTDSVGSIMSKISGAENE